MCILLLLLPVYCKESQYGESLYALNQISFSAPFSNNLIIIPMTLPSQSCHSDSLSWMPVDDGCRNHFKNRPLTVSVGRTPQVFASRSEWVWIGIAIAWM